MDRRTTAIDPPPVPDADNMIVVEGFTLNVEVDESNLDQAKQEVDQLFQQVDPSAESQPGEIAGPLAVARRDHCADSRGR